MIIYPMVNAKCLNPSEMANVQKYSQILLY